MNGFSWLSAAAGAVADSLSDGGQAEHRDDPYVPGHGPDHVRRNPWAGNPGPLTKTKKQDDEEIDRKATLSDELRRQLGRQDAVLKPYDPQFLKESAGHSVVQAYIDTLAQDLATAPWRVTTRDEETEADDEAIAQAERTLQEIHPEKSMRDVLEMTGRNMLTLGDAAWVKHYTHSSSTFAEAIPVDSSRLFRRVSKHGITEGYLQASIRRQEVADKLDSGEVVWFEWSSRPDHVYGYGPVEKGLRTIELLEELSIKEKKDLTEGMPPGIVSVQEGEGSRVPDDEFEQLQQSWKLEEGERHRALVTRGDWNFTPLQPNYNDLQILDRSKYWVQVLGAVFKVNSAYAGFDIENVNRATHESEVQAYAQRGFRVLLRQIEEALNRQLIWPDINPNLRFEFDRQRTIEEQKQHAEFLKQLADTATAWDKAGRPVTFRDESLEIEEGEIDVEEPEGEEGGPFGFSADDDEPVAYAAARSKSMEKMDPMVNGHQYDPAEGVVLCEAAEVAFEAETFGDITGECPECGQVMAAVEDADDWADQSTASVDTDKGAVGLTAPHGADPVESGSEVAFQNFVAELVSRGATVTDPELEISSEVAGAEAIPPTNGIRVHGLSVEEVEEVMAAYDGVNYIASEMKDEEEASGLSTDELERLDDLLLSAHESQIQPASLDDIRKAAWDGDDEVPEFVAEKIDDAIEAGAVFQDIEGVPDATVGRLEDILSDVLTQPQGWSLDALVDRMSDVWPGVDKDKLEVIARTETASVLNDAREQGYEEREDSERLRFKWQGPDDSRTTKACEWLKGGDTLAGEGPSFEGTNSRHGGEPVSMQELLSREEQASKEFFPNLSFRQHTIHPNERHTFVRSVSVPGGEA